jgi:hypothetical protein
MCGDQVANIRLADDILSASPTPENLATRDRLIEDLNITW